MLFDFCRLLPSLSFSIATISCLTVTGDVSANATSKRSPNISNYFVKGEDFSDPFGSIPARKDDTKEAKEASSVKEVEASSLCLEATSLDGNKTFPTAHPTADSIASSSSPEAENFQYAGGKRKYTPRVRFLDDVINDPFAAGFAIEPEDRRHDAWLPSEPTRQLLVSLATKKISPQSLTSVQLTRPGVLVCDVQQTVSSDLMKHLQAAIPGRQDEDGVRQYIVRRKVQWEGKMNRKKGKKG